MKIAIVHDWLVSYGGSERVLEQLLICYPQADIFTLIHKKGSQSQIIEDKNIKTSFMNNIKLDHKKLIALAPYAIEQFDLSGYDVVISNSFAVGQGVITAPDQLHISYMNRTMRYAWDRYHEDLREFRVDKGFRRLIAGIAYHYIRLWDYAAFQRPDIVVCNSEFSKRRIKKYYNISSRVMSPPVNLQEVEPSKSGEKYFVMIGRMVPLKGVNIAIEAFNLLNERLIIIGDGPKLKDYRSIAKSNVEFTGSIPNEQARSILSGACASICLSEEDFGIANAESIGLGVPVIAYPMGAVPEMLREGFNGILLKKPDAESLMKVIKGWGAQKFAPKSEIIMDSQKYSSDSFRKNFVALVNEGMDLKRLEGDIL